MRVLCGIKGGYPVRTFEGKILLPNALVRAARIPGIMKLQPFRALRPTPEAAATVASVPYDVVDRSEAAAIAADDPLSFLHVVRAEIDFPADVSDYDDCVYQRARENLDRLRADGVLIQDDEPCFYAYRLNHQGHTQIGIVGCVHIDDYENNVIKKHEKTTTVKENDRTRHILELNADAEPVLLTFRANDLITQELEKASQGKPLYDFTADDGVQHTVWQIKNTDTLAAEFAKVPACYVADGHHRCASAWRAGCELRNEAEVVTGNEEYHWFPAVLFASDQLNILPYNRLVTDLGELDGPAFLAQLAEIGQLTPGNGTPQLPYHFGFYVDGSWHELALDPQTIDQDDPIRSLDAYLLQERVFEALLGISDPRTDPRLRFVGGIRGTKELEARVDAGKAAIAIAMVATTVDQLLTVADAGAVMPPKSTWFEPKLRSGLFVHLLDEEPSHALDSTSALPT